MHSTSNKNCIDKKYYIATAIFTVCCIITSVLTIHPEINLGMMNMKIIIQLVTILSPIVLTLGFYAYKFKHKEKNENK